MKKNELLLTGIVFLIAILIAAGCGQNPSVDSESADSESAVLDSAQVILSIKNIICYADTTGGIMQFTMWDSDDTIVATPSQNDSAKFDANLVTIVKAKDLVFWEWDKDSDIDKFAKIGPPVSGPIIPVNAMPINPSWKIFFLRIPESATTGEEPYYIKFLWRGDTVTIDPHLKVPEL